MQLLKLGLAAGSTSPVFSVGNGCNFWVEMRSGGGTGFNGGTITMEATPDRGAAAFANYAIDGSAETWTAADKRRYVDGAAFYRFSAGANVSDVDIWVHGVNVLDVDA